MDLGLSGRTAIVLGASQGMGLAISEGLAAEGANVAMFSRRADVIEREAARVGGLAVAGDLTNAGDLDRLVTETLATFGGIDIVILNGGGPPPGLATSMTAADVIAAVELLLVPHVRLVGLCLSHLRKSGRGRIVAIESTSVKEPIANLALSNAVRPGVTGWLKTLARELGPDGITVNTIAPGRIDTERLHALYGPGGPPPEVLALIPARRVGSPAEIAAAVCFLASEQAAYVSGVVIPVDGGMLNGLF
ncbi:MAG: SDR family oxidoreductase [Thermoleophilia bacterium]